MRFHISNCFPTNVNNSKIVPKHLSGNLVSESNIRKMAAGDYNGITKECDEGFYDMYDNKKAHYLRTFVLFVLDLNQGPSD